MATTQYARLSPAMLAQQEEQRTIQVFWTMVYDASPQDGERAYLHARITALERLVASLRIDALVARGVADADRTATTARIAAVAGSNAYAWFTIRNGIQTARRWLDGSATKHNVFAELNWMESEFGFFDPK